MQENKENSLTKKENSLTKFHEQREQIELLNIQKEYDLALKAKELELKNKYEKFDLEKFEAIKKMILGVILLFMGITLEILEPQQKIASFLIGSGLTCLGISSPPYVSKKNK